MSPQDAVRSERTGGKLGNIGRRLSRWIPGALWLRYAIRNLLRARWVSLMTAGAVSLSLGVAISYFIAMTSFEQTLTHRFQDDRWDLAVDFLSPVWPDELVEFAKVPGVTRLEPYVRGPVRLVGSLQQRSALVTGISPGDSFRQVRITQGRELKPGDTASMILERKLSNELGYHIGDLVTIESRGQRYKVALVGTFSGVLPGEAYAPVQDVRAWLDLPGQSTGAFMAATRTPSDVRKDLFRLDRVGRVTLKTEVVQGLLRVVDEVMTILYVAETFAIAVAILLLFSSIAFAVNDRLPEYSVLRILGFGSATIRLTVLTEVVTIGLLGTVLAIPTAIFLAYVLLERASQAWFGIDLTLQWQDVWFIVVPALVMMPLAALPSIRRIERMSLLKILRERTFG